MGGLLNQILARRADHQQQQNLLNYQAELEANRNMSKQYFDMANNAEPELAPDLLKAGYAYGTAKIGDAKKLNKQFNLQDLLLKHSQAKYAPQNLEQPPQAPPQVGHTPPVQLHPDMPELGTVDESMINAHNGVQDQIQQQIKQANDQLAQQQVQAQAPPPVSGLPSPGFSSVMPAPPGGALPFPTLPGQPGGTTGFASDVNLQPVSELAGRRKQALGPNGDMYSAIRTPLEKARDTAMAEGYKATVQQQAELQRQLALEGFKASQRKEAINDLKKQGFTHFTEAIGSNGQLTLKPDPGHAQPGLVKGADLQDEIDPKTGKAPDPSKWFRVRLYNDETKAFFEQPDVKGEMFINDPNNPGQSFKVAVDRDGHEIPGTRIATLNPQFLPSTNTSTNAGFRVVQQPDGSTQLVPVTTQNQNTRQVVLPPGQAPQAGAPVAAPTAMPAPPGTLPPVNMPAQAAPGATARPAATPATPRASVRGPGVTVGGRSLSPEQMVQNEQKAEMLNNSIGIIKDLQSADSQKVLANLISTGKIEMQIDPNQGFWRAIPNKAMTLTPNEARVARDWQLLTEGVLQMRIPMGGAGFRGKEGFGAIESNKGILGQNPDIIRGVLDGTLREFRAQRNPLADGAKKYGYKVNPEAEATGMPAVPGATVNMRAPNGQISPVPADQVEHYKARGAVVVQ